MPRKKRHLTGKLALVGALGACSVACARVPAGYLEGLQDAESGHYQSAIATLKASYLAENYALTAYALSVCFERVHDYHSAQSFAVLALQARPPLPKAYVEYETEVLRWAAVLQARDVALQPRSNVTMKQATDSATDMPASTTDVNAMRYDPRARLQGLLAPLAKFIDVQSVETEATSGGPPTEPVVPLQLPKR